VILLVASLVVAGLLLRDGKWVEGGAAAAGALYFGLRAAGRLGRRGGGSR
jgi:hypothetical protein